MSDDADAIRADIEATRRRLGTNVPPDSATSRDQEERETESTAYAAPAYAESPPRTAFESFTPSISERVAEAAASQSPITDSQNAEIIERYARRQLGYEQWQAHTNAFLAMFTYALIGLAILGLTVYTYLGVRDVLSSSITIGLLLLISFMFGLGTVLYGLIKFKQISQSFRAHRELEEAQARFEHELSEQATVSREPEAVRWSASDG